jgi:proteasome lid subunit RPN8/RPN11
LRFTPYAWAKLTCLRDLGPTEIGGFGISAAGDPLLVEDVKLVRQRCTATTVRLLDEAVADYFDDCVDRGLTPDRFARLWLHTHPGASPKPSGTDEATLQAAFGSTDWSVMFVVARQGATYARLRFGAGPGGEFELPVFVDWSANFERANWAAWEAEYDACVEPETPPTFEECAELGGFGDDWFRDLPTLQRKEGRLDRSDR